MARPRRWLPLVLVGAVVALGGGVGLVLLVVSLTTLIPNDPARVADLRPPIADTSSRRLDPTRCGLVEVRREGACRPATPTRIVEEEVTFPSRLPHKGIAELRGTLSIPEGLEGPRPAVVIVHGSGPIPRDGPVPGDLLARYDAPFAMYRALAATLAEQGLVVLRYDKRTTHTYGDALDLDAFAFTDFVDDARDALDYLATRPEVDGRALVVVGHSQGGQLAPHIATGDDRVAAVLLLGGSTETLGKLMITQLERFGEVRKLHWDYVTQHLLWLNLAPIRACFEPIWDGTYDPDQACLGGVKQRALADYEALAATTGAVLQELEAPVFAIQGSCDINIDPDEIPRMRRLLEGRDAELHYVRGLDHALTDSLDPSEPVALDEEAVARIVAFLRSVPYGEPAPTPPP